MARILGVGIATLDIINRVAQFPPEDAEVRALDQRICRGGNCTNTLVVLAQLGHDCAWAGTCADEPDGHSILKDLEHYKIDTRYCRMAPQGKVPTSYVTLNTQNGSRTIVHFRDLPEYDAATFSSINIAQFDWLHVEGRNVEETRKMLVHARANAPTLPISIEIEKPRADIESLFVYGDVLLFSRPYAQSQGYNDAKAFLLSLRNEQPHAQLICTWGSEGAYAVDRDGHCFNARAYRPANVVDTLGAGDTFNAGIIHNLLSGKGLDSAIDAACHLAGVKCGHIGLSLDTGKISDDRNIR